MVFSLTDFDDLPLSSDSHGAPPVPPTSSSENQPSQATEESTSQQNSTLPVPALDPALAALSPQTSTPTQTTNPALHGEDLTQLARHLALQRSLSKHNTDELVLFAKVFSSANPPICFLLTRTQRSLGEQLVWIAATQLLLNESVLTAFGGEVSPTLLASSLFIVSTRSDIFLETHQTGSRQADPLTNRSNIQE